MRVGCEGFVVRHAPIRKAQGRLSDGLRGGSPRNGGGLGVVARKRPVGNAAPTPEGPGTVG